MDAEVWVALRLLAVAVPTAPAAACADVSPRLGRVTFMAVVFLAVAAYALAAGWAAQW